MISLSTDPVTGRTTLTAAITLYLDQILIRTLSAEVERAIREQAIRDLGSNKVVQRQIAQAATDKLLQMLGAPPPAATPVTPPVATPVTPRVSSPVSIVTSLNS